MVSSLTISQSCVGYRSRKASRALARLFNAEMRPLDLPVTQFAVLVAVDTKPDDTIAGLAGRLNTDPSSVVRLALALEKRGLLTSDNGRGRNGKRLALSASGRALLEQAMTAWQRTHDMITAELGEDEMRKLIAGLARLEACALKIENRLQERAASHE
jgi:DNA-binding MarR family transcriptional regulator